MNANKKLLTIILMLAMILVLIPTTAFAANLTFNDVKSGSWYYNNVQDAVNMGLINGKSETEFAPNDNMTYAEAVKLAACMHQKYTTNTIKLTNGTPWYQPYVDYAKANGIISQDYNWNAAVTRAGYMAIFANALPEKALESINTIQDGAIPDVAMSDKNADAIYKLYRAGIVQGVDSEYNCDPKANIQRSEVAAILIRMMDPSERKTFSLSQHPTITKQPISQKATDITGYVEFTVVATGQGTLKYEWQQLTDGKWTTIITEGDSGYGVYTSTLGYRYRNSDTKLRCIVTDDNGSVTSDIVTYYAADNVLKITKQPTSQTANNIASYVTFSVTAKGTGTLQYQWQEMVDGKWQPIVAEGDSASGVDTSTLQIRYRNHDVSLRCAVTDDNMLVYSNTVTMTVPTSAYQPIITKQPTSQTLTSVGDFATFTVVATGHGNLKYDWQELDGNWHSVFTEGDSVFGAEDATMKIYRDHETYLRCVVTDDNGSTISNQVTLYKKF